MKRTIALIVILLVVIGLFSCSAESEKPSVPPETETTASVIASDTEPQTEIETAFMTEDLTEAAETETDKTSLPVGPILFDSGVEPESFPSWTALCDSITSGMMNEKSMVLHAPKGIDWFESMPLEAITWYEDQLYTAVYRYRDKYDSRYVTFTRYDTADRMRNYMEQEILPYVTESGISAIPDAVITDSMVFDTGYGIGTEITYNTAETQNLRGLYAEISVNGADAVYTRYIENDEYRVSMFTEWTDADGKIWCYAVQTNLPWYGWISSFASTVFIPEQIYPEVPQTEPNEEPHGTCEITWDSRYYESIAEIKTAAETDTVFADSLWGLYMPEGLPAGYEMQGMEYVIGSDSYSMQYADKESAENRISMSVYRSIPELEASLLYTLDTDGTPDALQRNDLLKNFRISEEQTPLGTMQVTVYDTSVVTDLKTTYLDYTDPETGIRWVFLFDYDTDENLRYGRVYVFDRACPIELIMTAALDTETVLGIRGVPIT